MIKYAKRIENMEYTANVVKNLFASMTNPEIISFSGGAPAKEALPIDLLREISNDVLTEDKGGITALQYGPIEGLLELRHIVATQLLAPKGIECTADEIMICSGGLEGINLICQIFIDPGDVILVENPTFVHCVEIFDMFMAKCIGVDMDDDGIIIEDLEQKIIDYKPKMIYTIPTFQNPSGRTLLADRRRAVSELAEKYDILVLEDDPYRDIRFNGEDLKPIKAYDKNNHVVLANSFSKIFSPGVRLGYIMASKEVIEHLKVVKSATNSHTSMLPQVLAAEFFNRGYYPAHHAALCDIYKERCEVMLDSIKKFFPAGTKYSTPDGGLFTWVELPGNIDTAMLLNETIANPAVNVAFVAGAGFYVDRDSGKGKNCMRLSYGNTEPDRIREGIRRLGNYIKSIDCTEKTM